MRRLSATTRLCRSQKSGWITIARLRRRWRSTTTLWRRFRTRRCSNSLRPNSCSGDTTQMGSDSRSSTATARVRFTSKTKIPAAGHPRNGRHGKCPAIDSFRCARRGKIPSRERRNHSAVLADTSSLWVILFYAKLCLHGKILQPQ